MAEDPSTEVVNKKKAPFIYYVITALIPVLFFVILEGGLRMAEYGYDYKVFTKLEGYPSGMLYINPKLSYKYFSNLNSTVFRSGIGFQEEKPENGYRVFVLGGSSAQGFPYSPNASFPAHLQLRLDHLYPEKTIEVINLGASAINSHTLLDILPAVLEQSPDLILIYAGHNEYYGALGPGSSGALHPVFSKLLLNLRDFKTVQLIENLMNFSSRKNKDENASLMQKMIGESSIEFGSDIYERGLIQFDLNFSSMLEKIRETDIPVIVGTLSSNLAGHKPFISDQENVEGLTANDYYELGKERVLSSDSITAKKHFIQAKELDGLRFRAPEKINQLIREKAKEFNVPLVDNDSIFNRNSPMGVTGNNLMCDHLHPNMAGYFLMSRSFYQAIRKEGYLPDNSTISSLDESVLDSLLLADLPYTWYDSIVSQRTILNLLGNYPFVPLGESNPYQDELDNDGFRYKINTLEEVDSIRMIVAADFLARGDSNAFTREMRVFMSYFPAKEHLYLKTIKFLADKGLLNMAYPLVYEQLDALKENVSKAKMIGLYYMFEKRYDLAAIHLEKAAKKSRDDTYLLLNLGFTHLELEDYSKAVDDFTQVLKIVPENVEAYHQRGVARFELRDFEGTIKDMDQVIKLKNEADFLPFIIKGYARFGLNDQEGACVEWKSAADLDSEEARVLCEKFCDQL